MANFTYNVIYKGKDNTRGATSSVQRGIGGVSKAVAGLTAILAGGGFVLAGKQALEAADGIQKLRDRTGASTEFLSQMRHAVELTGGEFGTFSKGLTQLNRNVTAANEGMSTQVRAFERIGVSVDQLKGKSPEQVFALVADRLAGVEDPAIRSASAMDIFGRAGSELIPLLTQGSEGISQMRSEADLLGKTLSDDQVNAAAAANDAFSRLRAGIEGLVQTATIQFAPTLEGIANFLTRELPRAIKIAQAAFFVLRKTLLDIVSSVSDKLAAFYDILGNLPGDLGRTYRGAADDIRGFTSIIDDQAAFVQSQIDDIADSAGELAFKMGKIADVAEVSTIPVIRQLGDEMERLPQIVRDNPLPDPADIQQTTETIAETVSEVTMLGDEWEDAAQRAEGAWEGFLGFLPESLQGAIRSVTSGFSGLGSSFRDLVFGQEGGGAGIFGGLFGSGGQASTLLQALGPLGAALGAGGAIGGGAGGGALAGGLFGASGIGGGLIAGGLGSLTGGSVGGASLLTSLGGFAVPLIGAGVGAVIGAVVGRIRNNNTNTSSQISFGQSRGPQDLRITDDFGGISLGSGRDGFINQLGEFGEAYRALFDSLSATVTEAQRTQITGALQAGGDFGVTRERIADGTFVTDLADQIFGSLGGPTGAFVGQFSGDIEQSLNALQAINEVTVLLDAQPLESFAAAMAALEAGPLDNLESLSDQVRALGEDAFGSVEGMRAFGQGLQQFDQFVLNSRLNFENARRQVDSITGSTIERLRFETLSPDEQFGDLTRRARELQASIPTLDSCLLYTSPSPRD